MATIGPQFIFVHAQYKNAYLLDKATGKILATLAKDYKCTRFTLRAPACSARPWTSTTCPTPITSGS